MWIINEYGDAADISKAIMLTVAEKETENKKFFAVKAKFGMVAEGNMRGEGYGEFYESEMTLKNFDSSAEAQNYITRLVKNLNDENFRNDGKKLGYAFTW